MTKKNSIGLTTILLGALAVPAARAQEKNLILGKPYTYYPAPNYSYCTDEGDKLDLTDKFVATHSVGVIWKRPTTVGWAYANTNKQVVILFELEEEATLSELVFHTAGGGGSGVHTVGLRIFGSLDNQNYVPIGELPAPTPPARHEQTSVAVKLRVPLNQARAKYVAVAAMAPDPNYLVFVDEIELYGKMPADPDSALPTAPGVQGSSAQELQEVLVEVKKP